MESRSASSSTSVPRGANLLPIVAWKALITVGSFSFSRSKPDSWLGWFPWILKACLESHHHYVMVPSNICTWECSGTGSFNIWMEPFLHQDVVNLVVMCSIWTVPCIYGMFKIKLDFANICLFSELDEIPCCFIFCDVWELFSVSTSHKTIVRNSFSDLQNYTHHRKPHICCFLSQKTFSVAFTWKRIIDYILPKWQRCRPRTDYPEQHFLKRIAPYKVKCFKSQTHLSYFSV